jgi:hypothetical protein
MDDPAQMWSRLPQDRGTPRFSASSLQPQSPGDPAQIMESAASRPRESAILCILPPATVAWRSCAEVESAASRPRDSAILCILPPAIVAWSCCYFRHCLSLSSLKPPSSALIHICTATGRMFTHLTSSRLCASQRPVRSLPQGAYEFCRSISP